MAGGAQLRVHRIALLFTLAALDRRRSLALRAERHPAIARHLQAAHEEHAGSRIGRHASPVRAAPRARKLNVMAQVARRREHPFVIRLAHRLAQLLLLLGAHERIHIVRREHLASEGRAASLETAAWVTRVRRARRSSGRPAPRSARTAFRSAARTRTGIPSCPPARRSRSACRSGGRSGAWAPR